MTVAVSRRLRFEILRRDGHTCRYCGRMAPDVAMTVDHVTPTALGGSDDPSNLVAACDDCNGGKTSIAPGSPLVADVARDAIRWKRAIEQAHLEFEAEQQIRDELLQEFHDIWHKWTYDIDVKVPPDPVPLTGDPLVDNWHKLAGHSSLHSQPLGLVGDVLRIRVERGYTTELRNHFKRGSTLRAWTALLGRMITGIDVEIAYAEEVKVPDRQGFPTTRWEKRHLPLDKNWMESVSRFLSQGLTIDDLDNLVGVAMKKSGVSRDDVFRYFCGCAWNSISDLQESARRILESEAADGCP